MARKPPGYWTVDRLKESASNYSTRKDWKKNDSGAYGAAVRAGVLDECTQHMEVLQGFWTEEALIEDAKRFSTIKEWRAKSASAYATAKAKKLLDICTAHLERERVPSGFWSKERCRKEAKKYLTIKEWSLADGASYDFAKRNGLIEELTGHMIKTLSVGESTLYQLFTSLDLTFEFQKRFDDLRHKTYLPYDFYLPEFNLVIEYQGRQHFKVSKSSMYRRDFNSMQERDELKREYALSSGINYLEISAELPSDIEAETLAKIREIAPSFRLSKRALTDEELKKIAMLGEWDKQAVLEEARKYSTKTEWRYCGNSSEQIARKRGWYKEASAHMKGTSRPNGYWSKERVISSAAKHSSRSEWRRGNRGAYAAALAKGWIEEATKHMPKHAGNSDKLPHGYWTEERILENARKFKSVLEWRYSPKNSYRYALERGLLEAATAHMEIKSKPPGYWTEDTALEDAKKYSSKKEWRLSNSGGYRVAQRRGWLDGILRQLFL